jgi:exopolysaccharide production protein ExoZ
LESIHILRGIAALGVFIFHLLVTVDRYTEYPLRAWVEWGQFGVDLFFVISGFVMAYSARNLTGSVDAYNFLIKRYWRIAPLLYVLTIFHVFFGTILGAHFDLARIINSFTILPVMQSKSEFQYALVPAWTLGYEMAFYSLIALTVAFKRSAVWATIPIIFLVLLKLNEPFGSLMMIEFIYGLVAYSLWSRGLLGGPIALLSLSAFLLLFPPSDQRFIEWGVPAALMILAALSWKPGDGRILKSCRWLGTISYSLYLSHVVTFDALAPLVAPSGAVAMTIILSAAGMLIAWLVYNAIEAPFQRMGALKKGHADIAA